jgi:hypothetical protein
VTHSSSPVSVFIIKYFPSLIVDSRRNSIPNAWQCRSHDFDLCDTCMASSRIATAAPSVKKVPSVTPSTPTATPYKSKLHPHGLTFATNLTGRNCGMRHLLDFPSFVYLSPLMIALFDMYDR